MKVNDIALYVLIFLTAINLVVNLTKNNRQDTNKDLIIEELKTHSTKQMIKMDSLSTQKYINMNILLLTLEKKYDNTEIDYENVNKEFNLIYEKFKQKDNINNSTIDKYLE